MAETRSALTDPDQTTALINDSSLPSEIWSLIFQQLEPSFLNSILLTCKQFNAVAQSNTTMTPILKHFYPDESLESHRSSFSLFRKRYIEETHHLSPSARTMLDLCYYDDTTQLIDFITRTNIEPDHLFQEDLDHYTVLTHIVKLKRQDILNLLFEKVRGWFEKQAANKSFEDTFPFSLIFDSYNHDKPFNFPTKNKFILMDFAVALNQLSFIEENINHFVKPLFSYHLKYDFFQLACLYGHLDIVKFILANRDPLDDYFSANTDPLSCAVIQNNEHVVSFLIMTHRNKLPDTMIRFASLNAINDNRLPILELLLEFHTNNPDLCRELLDRACKVAQPNAGKLITHTFPFLLTEDISDYLRSAASTGCTELIKHLLSHVNNTKRLLARHPEIFVAAATTNNIETVDCLLDMGADIDGVNSRGHSALHYAILHGHLSMIQALIERGADLHLPTDDGIAPLDLAKQQLNTDITYYLMEQIHEHGKKRRAESTPTVEEVKEPKQKRPRY